MSAIGFPNRILAVLCAISLSSCAPRAISTAVPLAPSSLPFTADTIRQQPVSEGVVHRFIYSGSGPWAINVLDVQLGRCNSAVAVKGAPGAQGRMKTSDLMRELATTQIVVGGVNADFFLFTPPGVPTGVLVSRGKVITPPSKQHVFAVDSSGVPHIATFSLRGDTQIAVGDPALERASLLPFHPMEAVGGRPLIAKDSAMVAGIDSAGGATFSTTRHPRTAVGISNNGKRVLLVVVDGRQKGYSDGMTLRELATLMLALGARDALNLDGGGSTTMIYADSSHDIRVANRPSDATGERPVGDALGIVTRCAGR